MSLAEVCQVVEVKDHPNPEKSHLGVFILNTGAQLIGVNNEDGSRRFNVDDMLIHVKPGAIIPEHIINSGFENVKGGKIKASRFAGVESEGIMLNLDRIGGEWEIPDELLVDELPTVAVLGDDVAELLGITSA
jgi:tRNA-binding EMAP/Myf-like protein